MRSCGVFLAVAVGLFGCTSAAQELQSTIHSRDISRGFLETELILEFSEDPRLVEVPQGTHSWFRPEDLFGISTVQELRNAGVIAIRPVLDNQPQDLELASRLGLLKTFLVKLDGDSESLHACSLLERSEHIRRAEPVVVGEMTDDDESPDDPGFSNQYSLHNVGQAVGGIEGTVDADVDAIEAWTLSSGAGQIIIAVLDAGVSHQHPDLRLKLTDGYNSTGSGSTDDADDFYNSHGTHVAGIAAARSNNNEGMTGMSWGSQIMPVKIANFLGFTSDVWMGNGLIWAADNGASVAVISYGLDSGSPFLHSAIQYAYDRGVVICASTGNSGQDGVKYPAKYPETIAVGATDNSDQLASFSTTGPEVTVSAPGVDIFSTWHDFNNAGPSYKYQSGTSSSCPLVGGVAALVLSANPSLLPGQVADILKNSAEDLGDPGFDVQFGYGRVNAYRAVGVAIGLRVCIADVNLSGRIEPSDFSAWVSAYFQSLPEADQNANGLVEPSDFSAFLFNYNAGCY